jgi:PhnB protein
MAGLSILYNGIKEIVMPPAVKPIPEGYHAITPYLVVKNGAQAIDFYKKIFGATEVMRMPMPDGRIGHAQLRIGDSHIMLADEFPERGNVGPQSLGNSTVGILVYVDDCDATYKKSIDAGATVLQPIQDQFYGDRSGTIQDPFGHKWTIATHKEDVTPEEMQKRMAAMKG